MKKETNFLKAIFIGQQNKYIRINNNWSSEKMKQISNIQLLNLFKILKKIIANNGIF